MSVPNPDFTFSHKQIILYLAFTCMLVVQLGHLHLHNHQLHESGSYEIHVLGGHAQNQPHDHADEIDLQFQSLMAKIKILPDLLPLVFFFVVVLTGFTCHAAWQEFIVNFSRKIIFTLGPPSRASP
jgi:hypothetical protein